MRVTTPSQEVLLASLEALLRNNRGFTVATLNLDHIVKMRRHSDFRTAYERQSFVVADGNPIVWLRRIAGQPVDLVPGSDLVAPLIALAAHLGVPVALFGATEPALKAAAAKFQNNHPNLTIATTIAPSFGFDPFGTEADSCLQRIGKSRAGLCLVALGAPRQEIFALRGLEKLPNCGFVSVGAGLDFIAGKQKRAPMWVRRAALEWVWRLSHDWHRLGRRYWECALILPSLLYSAIGERLATVRSANPRK